MKKSHTRIKRAVEQEDLTADVEASLSAALDDLEHLELTQEQAEMAPPPSVQRMPKGMPPLPFGPTLPKNMPPLPQATPPNPHSARKNRLRSA